VLDLRGGGPVLRFTTENEKLSLTLEVPELVGKIIIKYQFMLNNEPLSGVEQMISNKNMKFTFGDIQKQEVLNQLIVVILVQN